MTADPELWAQIMESYGAASSILVEVSDYFYISSPEEVQLFPCGWCPRGHVVLHTKCYGHEVSTYDEDLDKAFDTLEGMMKVDVFYMGCNAVLGWERKLYWDEPTYTIRGHGTCVVVQKLYKEEENE
jgi:hypothetical protein